MTNARVREALTAGANVKDKGPHVADGILSVTPDAPEVAEWRSKCPLDCGGPSSTYLDDDDDGPKPNELYGKFTWKIENFSEISKRELRSNVFDVGNYKWYILVYPQGCDVCNHLSLFLCVADYDKLLPGWSHFAQFTIAVVNKDPKKSKYSDTLHRFCKKEHDWGWKKFMELSKVLDGFTVAGTLVIKAQVQVILDKPSRPFRCLDPQYRRELVRVYLTNVEAICRRVCEEKRVKMAWVRDNLGKFRDFWNELNPEQQKSLMTEKGDVILKGIVKQFFNEKEVTSTLVMDALLSGCKQIEEHSRLTEEGKSTDALPCVMINADKNIFSFGWGILDLLEGCTKEFLPTNKDDKMLQGADGLGLRSGQDGDDYRRDSIERDEKRLAELGRRSVEMFVIAHLFSEQLEIAFREAEALKKQDQLIAEEEEAERREESRLQAKAVADREKRAKKKERKKQKKEAEKARKDAEELERMRNEEERRILLQAMQEEAASSQETAPSGPDPLPQVRKTKQRNKKQPPPSTPTPTTSTPLSTEGHLNGPAASPFQSEKKDKERDTQSDKRPKDREFQTDRRDKERVSLLDKSLSNGKPHSTSSHPRSHSLDSPTDLGTSTTGTQLPGGPYQRPDRNLSANYRASAAATSSSSGPLPAALTAAAVGALPLSKPFIDGVGLPRSNQGSSSSSDSSSSSSSSSSSRHSGRRSNSSSLSLPRPPERSGVAIPIGATHASIMDVCTTSQHGIRDGGNSTSRDSSQERGAEEIIGALQERVLFLEHELAGRDSQIAALKAKVTHLEGQVQAAGRREPEPMGGGNSQPQQQLPSQQQQQQQQLQHLEDRWAHASRTSSRPLSMFSPDYPHHNNDSSRCTGSADATSHSQHSHLNSHASAPTPSPSHPVSLSNGPTPSSVAASSSAATAPVQSWAATPDNYSREFPPLQPPTPAHDPPVPVHRPSPSTTSSSSDSVLEKSDPISASSNRSPSPAPTSNSPDDVLPSELSAEPSPRAATTMIPTPTDPPVSHAPNPPLVSSLPSSSTPAPGNIPSVLAPNATISSQLLLTAPLPSLAPLHRSPHPFSEPPTPSSASSSPQPPPSCSTPVPSSAGPPTSTLRIPLIPRVPTPTPAPNATLAPSVSDHLSSLSLSNQPASPVTPQLLNLTPASPHAGPLEPAPTLLRTQSMPSHLEPRKDYATGVILMEHANGRHTPTPPLPSASGPVHITPTPLTRSRPIGPVEHPGMPSPASTKPSPYNPTPCSTPLQNGISPLSLHSHPSLTTNADFPSSKSESTATPSYRNAAAAGVMTPTGSGSGPTSALTLSTSTPPPLPTGSLGITAHSPVSGGITAPSPMAGGLTAHSPAVSNGPLSSSHAPSVVPPPPAGSVIPVSASMVGPIPSSSKMADDVVVAGGGTNGSNGGHAGPRGFGPPPSRFGLGQQGQSGQVALAFASLHSKAAAAMAQRPRHVSPSENQGLDDFAHMNLITDLLTD